MIHDAKIRVRFYKIMSHTDIDGNEEADRLANMARSGKHDKDEAKVAERRSGMIQSEGVLIKQ